MNHRKQETLSNPRELVHDIAASNEYLKARGQGRRKAFASAALAMSNNPELIPRDAQELKIISLLPGYLDAKERLSDTTYHYGSHDERRADLGCVIPLNHALRELIDANQRLTMPVVKGFVADIMMQTEGPLRAERAKEFVGMTLNGMRHEIAAENAFWQVPAVEDVRQASAEEDAKGRDLIVVYKGQEIPFDIKASQISADTANENSKRGHDLAMYSGFTSEDFGNSFRPSVEATENLAPYYEAVLEYSTGRFHSGLRQA